MVHDDPMRAEVTLLLLPGASGEYPAKRMSPVASGTLNTAPNPASAGELSLDLSACPLQVQLHRLAPSSLDAPDAGIRHAIAYRHPHLTCAASEVTTFVDF